MKRLLACSAVFYCLGIVFCSRVRVSFWHVFFLAALVFTAACLGFRVSRIFTVSLFCLVFLLGILSTKNAFTLPKSHINNLAFCAKGTSYRLSGFVDSQPVTAGGRTSFILRLKEVQCGDSKWACCGRVLVSLGFPQELHYADGLLLIGTLRRPRAFSAAGRSYRNYLFRQDIYLLISIKNSRQIIPQAQKNGNKLVAFSIFLRAKLEQVIRTYLPGLSADILSAMVLGQKSGVPRMINQNMVKSGTVHILVVSGFNVGIVAFIAELILRIMRIPRSPRIIIAIACLLLYCLITGASNPVIRATVMGTIFLSAYLFKREADIYNSLVCAALFILVPNPRQLFDVGFQLSFASVLAIVYFYPKLRSFLPKYGRGFKGLRFIGECLMVSLCAWAGTAGLVAYNFRIISPVTVLANILIVPLAALITLCGFSLVLCGSFSCFLGEAFGAATSLLITLLLNINAAVIKIPGAYLNF